MGISSLLKTLFLKTAWEMTPPRPYSAFHLVFMSAGILASCLLACGAARFCWRHPASRKSGRSRTNFVLGGCGLLLAAMELYKQGFLFYVVNGEAYDWWYFPFQLCSIPMYLCLLYPWVKSDGWRLAYAAFLQDFGLLGGIMALLVPPGLMYPFWTLTLHGFLWHFLLIFAGMFCAMAGLPDRTPRGFAKALLVFFPCCLGALAINTALGPEANADMFYISPYHPSSQPIFCEISAALGILPGIFIYLCCVILGGAFIHCLAAHLTACMESLFLSDQPQGHQRC